MHKAIREFDGSDSSKCISVKIGDQLSAVHAVDDAWYIGHNERSGETGAFPVTCIQAVRGISLYLTPAPGADEPSLHFDNPIYSDEGEMSEDHTRSHSPSTARHEPIHSKDDDYSYATPHATTTRPPPGNLQHLHSVTESVMSWGESFEHSLGKSITEPMHMETIAENAASESTRSENLYHSLEEDRPKKGKSKVDKVLRSDRGENAAMKAVFGVICGILVGCVLFILLVYSFSYTLLRAGIIVAVSTVIFCICLALSSLCRCIMALVLPNFFTGKGRAVFLSVIFGFMLAGPITNITYNAKVSGHSLACVIDLVADQAKVLQRQMAQPVKQMAEYVAKQKQELDDVIDNVDNTLGKVRATLDDIDNTLVGASNQLDALYQKCREPITDAVNECRSICQKLSILSGECLSKCSYLHDLDSMCEPLKTGDNFVTRAAKRVRTSLDVAVKFFEGNVTVKGEVTGNANTSKSAKSVEAEVSKDIDSKSDTFNTIFDVIKKLLSLSILLLFIQSFWYLRNYLSKDGYDNVYITKQFRALDEQKSANGQTPVLPLKKKEHSKYVDTSSIKLNAFELKYCRLGVAQVLVHCLMSIVVILFDYALFYILNLVRKYGSIDLKVQGQGTINVDVKGGGPVAQFYRILLKGMHVEDGFAADLYMGRCLPNPTQPSEWTIPVLFLMYLVAIGFCLLRGYGMRLRRTISAYYYPEQERARLEFLHKTIRHRRAGELRFLRQEVKSTYKERTVKNKLRLSAWIAEKCSCVERCLPAQGEFECTSCEQASGYHKVNLSKCDGERNGVPCEAAYCDECKAGLDGICPLCSSDDVTLRD